MKRFSILITGLITLFTNKAYAYDFEVDGIYYNIIGENEVGVTYDNNNLYEGEIIIPSEVVYLDNQYSVHTICESAFANCTLLEKIIIPKSIQLIGYRAFSGCSLITEFFIPNEDAKLEEEVFSGCVSLKSINIPQTASEISIATFYNCESLESVEIPGSVKLIGSNAFHGCKSLREITLPLSVTIIYYGAFANCTSLEYIYIPYTVKELYNPFIGCDSLQSIEINPNNLNYNSLNGVVYNKDMTELLICPNGKIDLYIPNQTTEISIDAFKGCKYLERIEVDPENTRFSSIDGILYNKKISELIFCPKGKKEINIQETVSVLNDNSFSGCSNLEFIYLPNSIIKIGNYTFEGCTKLKYIKISDELQEIGKHAFDKCLNLTHIILPETLKQIDDFAFYGCNSIKYIVSKAILPPICGFNVFDEELTNICNLYVMDNDEAISNYKNISPWNLFNLKVLSNYIVAESITIIGVEGSISIGENLTLGIEIIPEDTTFPEVSWYSSNEEVASIDEFGNLNSLAEGSTTITATLINQPDISANVEITVSEISNSNFIKLSPDEGLRVYNLNGKLILDSTSLEEIYKLNKGIYIINGKKVLIIK